MTLPQALATLARLMSPEHAETLDPIQLARAEKELAGKVKIEDLHRFQSEIEGHNDGAEYQLYFYKDEEGHYCISGHIWAVVNLVCQRCLGRFETTLKTDTQLMVVKSLEEAREIPATFDPVLNNETLTLNGLVEDELLLALPTVPTHTVEECPVKLESNTVDKEVKKNPFAELSKLKVKK